MKRNKEDCPNCFVKDCDCECNTCTSKGLRNLSMSQAQLDRLNFEDAILASSIKENKTKEGNK